jgi:hypothetical protein
MLYALCSLSLALPLYISSALYPVSPLLSPLLSLYPYVCMSVCALPMCVHSPLLSISLSSSASALYVDIPFTAYAYVCMSVCAYVCMSVCAYVCMSVCAYVCMSVCAYVCMSLHSILHTFIALTLALSHALLYIYVYLCLCLSMPIYIYAYLCLCLSMPMSAYVHPTPGHQVNNLYKIFKNTKYTVAVAAVA